MTVGLLGMAGLQTYSLKNNTSAYHRSQANTLAYDILDSMRANRGAALKDEYDHAYTASAPTASTSQANSDIYHWRKNLSYYLPMGIGGIDCSIVEFDEEGRARSVACMVNVLWDDNRRLPVNESCASSPASCQQMLVSTRL